MSDTPDRSSTADAFDDDTAWLLADFDPESRPGPASRAPTSAIEQADPPTPPAVAASPTAQVRQSRAWMAIGVAFQPLPGGPLLARTDTVPPAAITFAEPGNTVHAVLAGSVHRSGAGMELRSDDGRVVGYRGDAVVQWTAGDGERLPAGAILGWVSAPTTVGTLSTITIYLQGADGVAVDPVGWLAGLADPRELGLSSEITGGVDPFLIDLRLGGHLDGEVGP